MNWLKKLFGKSVQEQLQAQTIQTKQVLVPVKNEAYHELVLAQDGSYFVRIYKRKEGLMEEMSIRGKEEAQKQALSMLRKFNGV